MRSTFALRGLATADIAAVQQRPRFADSYTPLHQLEVPTAFEMLVGRDAITREECDAIVEAGFVRKVSNLP